MMIRDRLVEPRHDLPDEAGRPAKPLALEEGPT
jgi:hypothetical protein